MNTKRFKFFHITILVLMMALIFLPTIDASALTGNYKGIRLPCPEGKICPVNRGGAGHGANRHAVDFDFRTQNVFAIRGGLVREDNGWQTDGLGTYILIDHLDGYCSVYGHLSKSSVKEGKYISQGQLIAISGNTGNSTGPHLHIAVTRKTGTNCSINQTDEVPMIFDELPTRELNSKDDTLVSKNKKMLFADVYGSHPFRLWIEKFYADHITSGCNSQSNIPLFCSEKPLTRAEMAVWLLRVKHDSDYQPPAATGIFADVDPSNIFIKWIEQLYREGITKGCDSSANPPKFCPTQNVTRAEIAVFLLRIKHGSNYQPPAATGIFADVDPSNTFINWIEQVYREGISKGCDSSANPPKFCPDKTTSRGEAAVFLLRVKYGSNYQP